MKKMITICIISLVAFACSRKMTYSASDTTMKTSSATVTHEEYIAGKAVYEANCNKCHAYKPPQKHTAQQWVKWVDKMSIKAKLTAEQKKQLYDFVSTNAKGT